ncbi:MAG TPA: GNAT family N-acetyltransferase [Candidatus Dormibacteraeota bacterium]
MTLPVLPTDADLALRTARLRLDPLTEADSEELFGVLHDIRLHRFIGGEPPTLAQLRAWEARVSPDGDQLWLNWTVRLAATGEAVGYVQATVTDGGAEIAYVVGTEFCGRGIATEAVEVMCAALRAMGVSRLRAHIHPEHVISAAVARRAGLVATARFDDEGEELWSTGLEGNGE